MVDKIEDKSINGINKTRQLVLTALLFAVALILAIIENSFPPLPIAVPGVKLGLSNIAVMYALFFLGYKQAYGIAILKGIFVFFSRGLVAGLLSTFGGILSISIMLLLMLLYKDKVTYLILSVMGAVFHNLGQFIAIVIILNTYLWPYLPVLIISGAAAGIATSTLLKFILPVFKRLGMR